MPEDLTCFKARGIFAQNTPAVAIPAQFHLAAMLTGFDTSEALSDSVTGEWSQQQPKARNLTTLGKSSLPMFTRPLPFCFAE